MRKSGPRLAVTALVAAATMSGPASAAPGGTEPPPRLRAAPVLNAPVFNDPLGTEAEKTAVVDQLTGLIDATQGPDGEINLAMHEWMITDQDVGRSVADALKRANDEGVAVKVILDAGYVNTEVPVDSREYMADTEQHLAGFLGRDTSQDKWVYMCPENRGCLGQDSRPYGYMHNKFATFSHVETGTGGVSPGVVYQSSSNLHNWYRDKSFNDAYTLASTSTADAEYEIYEQYRGYFTELAAGGASPPNPDSYHTYTATNQVTGTEYRVGFYPHRQLQTSDVDPMVEILDNVNECRYPNEDGTVSVTDIRFALTGWTTARPQIAEKVKQLARQGCSITVIITPEHVEDVVGMLMGVPGITVHSCGIPVGGDEIVPHTKLTMVKGPYNGDAGRPRIITGSANFTSLPTSDDVALEIADPATYAEYAEFYDRLKTACGL